MKDYGLKNDLRYSLRTEIVGLQKQRPYLEQLGGENPRNPTPCVYFTFSILFCLIINKV